MSGYKLIAFDVDGTLLKSDKKASKAVIDAVDLAANKGAQIVLTTGRCVAELDPVIKVFPHIRYAVCTSGTLIYDFRKREAISKKSLPWHVVDMLYSAVRYKDVMVQCMSEGHTVIERRFLSQLGRYYMKPYESLYREVGTWVDDIWDYVFNSGNNVEKINIYHASVTDREDTFRKLSAEEAESVYAEVTSIETTAKGVSKASGLEELCGITGIDLQETIAVGDADNDISCLKSAGFAVAMGNANDNVKSIAHAVVSDNDHDGAAEAIYKYLI